MLDAAEEVEIAPALRELAARVVAWWRRRRRDEIPWEDLQW